MTGKSRGYRFVRFISETTATTARKEMNGQVFIFYFPNLFNMNSLVYMIVLKLCGFFFGINVCSISSNVVISASCSLLFQILDLIFLPFQIGRSDMEQRVTFYKITCLSLLPNYSHSIPLSKQNAAVGWLWELRAPSLFQCWRSTAPLKVIFPLPRILCNSWALLPAVFSLSSNGNEWKI